MSAWIVSRKHIDYMVTAILAAELSAMSPDELGRMLWRECLASVAYRYPGDGDGERPGPAAPLPRRLDVTATSRASTPAGMTLRRAP